MYRKVRRRARKIYGWLYKDTGTSKARTRVSASLLEEDAFDQILQDWRKQGYPFDHLVPSLATAQSASIGRPPGLALAELMGVILNNGVEAADGRRSSVLHFAPRHALSDRYVAGPRSAQAGDRPGDRQHGASRADRRGDAQGTGTRIRNAFLDCEKGAPLAVGGKTGTGDNRYDRCFYGPGGQLISSRVVDRTGTASCSSSASASSAPVTAYVAGAEAAELRVQQRHRRAAS